MNFSLRLANDIEKQLRSLLDPQEDFVPLHEPEFNTVEENVVLDCIRSGWVSSVGQYVDQFEHDIASACGAQYGVAVVNGTAALEVALRVVGVTLGDEVLIPSMTFIATANAVSHLGAVPHFVDVNEASLGVDPFALRAHLERIVEQRDGVSWNGQTGRRLACIVPMHTFGHPVDMPELNQVAADFGLPIVEDAAEALGSRLDNQLCGSFGRVAALSFNGNKILTTGGGGAIVTNDPKLAHHAKHLTTTAKTQHRWAFFHDEVGYNYRMPNINAALGVAQLKKLEERIAQKRALAAAYIQAFAGHADLDVFKERPGVCANYWLNTILLKPHATEAQYTILETLNDNGLMARPIWEPLHRLPIYANVPVADMTVTNNLSKRLINIPSSAHLAKRLSI